MWSRDDPLRKNTPEEPRGVSRSPRNVQRVKAHGQGDGAIPGDPPGNEFTRSASRGAQWLEKYFRRLQDSEIKKEGRKNPDQFNGLDRIPSLFTRLVTFLPTLLFSETEPGF
jgi:hypothetical protein